MTKKEQLKSEIIKNISGLDIAGYLKEEIEKILEYFHYYKLKNISNNIDFLKEYLLFLDCKNTKQLIELSEPVCNNDMLFAHDIYYYVSKDGLTKVGEKKLKQKIWENDFNLTSLMLGTKGFLLLTMDEFCNATPVRLSINKILWKREKALIEAKKL